MKKVTRLICTVLAMAMLFSMAAFAAEYESGHSSYTADNNYSYDYWSSLYTGSPNIAAGWICESDYVKVPVSYIGAQGRAFDENKKLIDQTEMLYNEVVDNFVVAAIDVSYTGRMYSQGVVEIYDGTDYVSKTCPMTVKVNGGRSLSIDAYPTPDDITEYEVNDDGETYGSLMFSDSIGYEPDLISAVGNNGLSGYVRNDELNIKINNPKEAMTYMKNLADSRTIPVYDLNGNIIDSFTVRNTKALSEELNEELKQKITERKEANRRIVETTMNSRSNEYIPALGFATGDVECSERISGYVSQKDIDGPMVNTPDEAIAYMKGFAGIRFPVHLYDAEGNIIGEFWSGGGSSFSSMNREEIIVASNGRIK